MQSGKWVTLVFAAICLVAVAGMLNLQHLYYMAAILLTLPGISYLLGWHALRGLEFQRDLPPTAWEGEEGQIVYAVHNSSGISRFFLSVREVWPDWIVPTDSQVALFNVAPRETTRVAHTVVFRRRGVYRARHFDVIALDPLGVFAFTRRIACEGDLVVYPKVVELQGQTLSGSDSLGWQEYTRTALRGSSVEPDGVREYEPGDPLRRVHWRQTARTGKLRVIDFEETQATTLVVALDLVKGSNYGRGIDTSLEYAVRLAASLASLATRQGATLRLLVPEDAAADEMDSLSFAMAARAGRGQEQLHLILNALARVDARSQRSAAGLVKDMAGDLLPGTTFFVLTSQIDRDLPAVLNRYTASGTNVAVAYIDPATFEGAKGRGWETRRELFMSDLLAARVAPFVVRYDAENALIPEAITYVEPTQKETLRN